MQLSDKF